MISKLIFFTHASLLMIPGPVPAAPVQVRRAEVAAAAPALPGRDRMTTVGSLGAKEQDVLKKLQVLTSGQITELLEVYARMGNRRMASLLSQELLRRDPRDTRPRELAASLLQSAFQLPDDPAARAAEAFLARGQPGEAARTLAELKARRYSGRVFPWQEELAYAWYEAGQTAASRTAFGEILTVPGYPEKTRAEALQAVRMITVDQISKAGDEALRRRESGEALRLAEQLLAANPNDPDGVALKSAAMAAAGQTRQAIDYLLSLKASVPGKFRHQLALVSAYQAARMYDDAQAACGVLLQDPALTPGERTLVLQSLKDIDRAATLTAGDHALRRGELVKAEQLLAHLETIAPGHADTAGLKAAVQLKRRQYGNARETLTQLRQRSAARQEFFESRDSLAQALAATGSPREAKAEYVQVKDDARFDTLTRYEAARRTADLASRYQPGYGQELQFANEAEGTRVTGIHEIATGEIAGSPNVFLLRAAWDTVELDQSRLLLMKQSDRYQVELAWRRHMKQGFFGEISAGGAESGAVYGAAFGRYPQPGGTSWRLGFRGNDRAMDSLPLIALDGRQNQIAFAVQRDVTDRLSLDAAIRYRWVDVRNRDLGEGLNVNLNASYTLITETLSRPELTLSYLGELQRFARQNLGQDFGDRMVGAAFRGPLSGQALADNIIEERFNRHGLILTLSKKFSPRFSGHLYGGFAREFEYGDNQGLLGGGVEAFIGPRLSLFLNADYSTSGRAGSRGSEVWSATTGAKVVF